MEGRQRLGAVLVVVGVAMVAVGGAALAGSGSPTAAQPTSAASAPAAPVTAAPVTTTPLATAGVTPPPTAAPTADTLAIVRAFFDRLQAAVRAGTQGGLADSLGAATIERYGREQCATALAAKPAVSEQTFEILGIRPPAAWDYVTDELTTTVPDTTTVDARVTGPDAAGVLRTETRELHVQVIDGVVSWFTDCGDPLTAP
jgi:hypothetical protein